MTARSGLAEERVTDPVAIVLAERLHDRLAELAPGEFTGEVIDLARDLAEDLTRKTPDTQGVDG